MSNGHISARSRRDHVQCSVGRQRAPHRQDKARERDVPMSLYWLVSLLAPAVREILVSYQKTFLERHRIQPVKRSCSRHQLVGKVLSYVLLCRMSWQSSVWYLKHVPLCRPFPSRSPWTSAGLPGRRSDELRMFAWLLSHTAVGQSQDCKPKLCSFFPDLLPNGMNKSIFLSLNFPIPYKTLWWI